MTLPRFSIVLFLAPLLGCHCGVDSQTDAGAIDPGTLDAGTLDAGPPDSGLPDSGQDAGPDEYCPLLARARCDRELTCGFLGPSEQPTCLTRLTLECGDDFRRANGSAARFIARAATQCAASISTLRCAEGPLSLPLECGFHAVFEPGGQAGAHCVDSQDCVAGACAGTSLECRTCRPFAPLGQPCGTDRRCDPTVQFCALGSPRLCATLLRDGAPCGSSGECQGGWCNWSSQVPDAGPDRCGHQPLGAGCGDPADCEAGAWCRGYFSDGVSLTAGLCAPRIDLGQPCANSPDDDGCVGPASCLEGRCAVAAPYSLDAGAECERLDQCQEAYFCRGLETPQADGGRSLRSGVCSPRLPPDAPCNFSTYVDTDCSAGTTCGKNGTCVVRAPADAGCQARFECQDFLACTPSTQRCTSFSLTGQPCESPGSVCLDSFCGETTPGAGFTCQTLFNDGAACSMLLPEQCASRRCLARAGGDATCQPSCLP